MMPNNKKAYTWFALAFMNGKENSLQKRDEIASKLSKRGLEEAQEEAAKLYKKMNNRK